MPEVLPIALLSQPGDTGRHLRDALVDTGAPIVYEAQAAELDRERLERSGARVVVVNLDNEVEAHLDAVYDLIGDDRYNVIFNEAQVSSQLSGWEQARWARHLVAKILGREDADPPRPKDAEPVPQPMAAQKAASQAPEVVMLAANDTTAEMSAAEAPVAEHTGSVVEPTPAAADIEDFADILSLLDEVDSDRAGVEAAAAPAPNARDHSLDTRPLPELDLSEFAQAATDAADPSATQRIEALDFDALTAAPAATGADDLGFADLDVFGEADIEPVVDSVLDAPEPVVVESSVDELGFADLADFGDEPVADASIQVSLGSAEPIAAAMDSDPDDGDLGFADLDGFGDESAATETVASATQSDPAASALDDDASDLAGLELLEIDFDEPATESPAANATTTAPKASPVAAEPSFNWSLESIDDSEAPAPAASPAAPVTPQTFGIEKISAADYLAPEAGKEPASDEADAFDGLSLELVPLEEAVAPQSAAAAPAEREGVWLDPSAARAAINRVVVIGASIGGPEAVREFLAEVPKSCQALFLLAQHMGAEFMQVMAQQLARTTQLVVRMPTHGERVGHGDIIIVPTTHRLRVDKQGVVLLEALNGEQAAHSPSIDLLLHDIADVFGAKATALIFSGMAEDAAQGSLYLHDLGGAVYAQDPDTCVISSMVDGVIATGAVTFTGSPRALAERVLGDIRTASKA